MKKLGASVVVLLCTIMAMISICSVCYWWSYQPELPRKPQD
ncbi:MAG TPA: cyclic lactone autoinducer peptide [Bacillota bacterium]|nr:cyclic lactone autoinducer peptide [Bacillota bacterium]